MIDISAVFANFTGSGPLAYTGKNATGAGATDGTEFIAAMIDNWMWGWTQRLFTMTGITPNGVTESASASQVIDAIQLLTGPPGTICEWNLNADPSTFGARFLLLNGQGVLVASYVNLDANTWVGAGLNATASYFYRADDAAGTIRNSSGAYLILPESRGYTTRGLDVAASIDPDGASRDIGHLQDTAMQGHFHPNRVDRGTPSGIGNPSFSVGDVISNSSPGNQNSGEVIASSYGTPNLASESRMTNRATKFAIRY